jgi:oligo-1,6-glucosidase
MQWDSSPNAGFSPADAKVKPWMRVHDDYRDWNVAKQKDDPDSVFSFWKRMLAFRKKWLSCVRHPSLPLAQWHARTNTLSQTYGTYTPLSPAHEEVYAYTKTYAGEHLLVVLNFSSDTVTYTLPDDVNGVIADKVIDSIGNYSDRTATNAFESGRRVELRAYEGIVVVKTLQKWRACCPCYMS